MKRQGRSNQRRAAEFRDILPASLAAPVGVPRHIGITQPRLQSIPIRCEQLNTILGFRDNALRNASHNNQIQRAPASLDNPVSIDKNGQVPVTLSVPEDDRRRTSITQPRQQCILGYRYNALSNAGHKKHVVSRIAVDKNRNAPVVYKVLSPVARHIVNPCQLPSHTEAPRSDVRPVITNYNCNRKIINPPAAVLSREHNANFPQLNQQPVVTGYVISHTNTLPRISQKANRHEYTPTSCITEYDRKLQINDTTTISQPLLPSTVELPCGPRRDCTSKTQFVKDPTYLCQKHKPETATIGAYSQMVYIQPNEPTKHRAASKHDRHVVENINQYIIPPKQTYHLKSPKQLKTVLRNDYKMNHSESSEPVEKTNVEHNQTEYVLPPHVQDSSNNMQNDMMSNKQKPITHYACKENPNQQAECELFDAIHDRVAKNQVSCTKEKEIIEIGDDSDEENTDVAGISDNCVFDLGKYMNRADVPTINPCIITGNINMNFNVNGNRKLCLQSDVTQNANTRTSSCDRKRFSIVDGKVYLEDETTLKDKPHCEMHTHLSDRASVYQVQTYGENQATDSKIYTINNHFRCTSTRAELFPTMRNVGACHAESNDEYRDDNSMMSPHVPLITKQDSRVHTEPRCEVSKRNDPIYKDNVNHTHFQLPSSTVSTMVAKEHPGEKRHKITPEHVDVIRKQLHEAIAKTAKQFSKGGKYEHVAAGMTAHSTHQTRSTASCDLEKDNTPSSQTFQIGLTSSSSVTGIISGGEALEQRTTPDERTTMCNSDKTSSPTEGVGLPSSPMDVKILRQIYFNSPQQNDSLQRITELKAPRKIPSHRQSITPINAWLKHNDASQSKTCQTTPCTVPMKTRLPNAHSCTSSSKQNKRNVYIPKLFSGNNGKCELSNARTPNTTPDQNKKATDDPSRNKIMDWLPNTKTNAGETSSVEEPHISTCTINTRKKASNLDQKSAFNVTNNKSLLQEVLNDIHQIESGKIDTDHIDNRNFNINVKSHVSLYNPITNVDSKASANGCEDTSKTKQECEVASFVNPLINDRDVASVPVASTESQNEKGVYKCVICKINFSTQHALQTHEHIHVKHDSLHICSETKHYLEGNDNHDIGYFINDEDTGQHVMVSGNTSVKDDSYMSVGDNSTSKLSSDIVTLDVDAPSCDTQISPTEDYYNLMVDDNDRDMVPLNSASNTNCGADNVNSVFKRHAPTDIKHMKIKKRRKKHSVSVKKKRYKNICFKCGRSYESSFMLECHVNFCRQKGKHVYSQATIGKHTVNQMGNSDISFDDEQDMKNSEKDNVKIVVTDICSPDCRQHMCDICGSSFAYKIQMMKHALNHDTSTLVVNDGNDENEYKCKYCSKTFESTEQLLLHIHQHKLECETCGINFKKLFSLYRHVNRYHNRYDTDDPKKNRDQVEYHDPETPNIKYISKDDNTSDINVNNTDYPGLSNDNDQLSNVEPLQDETASKYTDHIYYSKCKFCGYQSSSRKETLLHRYRCLYSQSQKFSNNDPEDSNIATDNVESSDRTCIHCKKSFQSPQYAKLHVQFCTALLSAGRKLSFDETEDSGNMETDDVLESNCEEIKQLEIGKKSLFQHHCVTHVEQELISPSQHSPEAIRQSHILNEENYKQTINDTSQSNIQNGILPFQELACKLFRCKLCDRSFKKTLQLKNHFRRSHRFKCNFCGTKFQRKKDYSCHSKSCVNMSQEKCPNTVHKCQFCGKKVKKINHLKVHLLFCNEKAKVKNAESASNTENMEISENLDVASAVTENNLGSEDDSVGLHNSRKTKIINGTLNADGNVQATNQTTEEFKRISKDDMTLPERQIENGQHGKLSAEQDPYMQDHIQQGNVSPDSYTHGQDTHLQDSQRSKVSASSNTCDAEPHIQCSQQSDMSTDSCPQDPHVQVDSQQSEQSSGSYTCDNVKNTCVVFECQECSAMFTTRLRLHKHMMKWHADKLAHYYGGDKIGYDIYDFTD